MRPFRNPQRGVVTVAMAAAVFGLSGLSAASYAQDESAHYAAAQSPGASNSEMAARVMTALKADPTFDSRHVSVAIEKGQVVLKGFVQSSNGVLDATRIATKAAGDRKIVNNLTIKQDYSNAP